MPALVAQLLHDQRLCGRGRREDEGRRLQGDAAHETDRLCAQFSGFGAMSFLRFVTGSRHAISRPTATCFEVIIIDFNCIRCRPNNRLQQISDPLLAPVDRRQRMKQIRLFAPNSGKD